MQDETAATDTLFRDSNTGTFEVYSIVTKKFPAKFLASRELQAAGNHGEKPIKLAVETLTVRPKIPQASASHY